MASIKDFIDNLNNFLKALNDKEKWNMEGRTRMDDLLKPGSNLLPEERVMYTMELQGDIENQLKQTEQLCQDWKCLEPTCENEKSSNSEVEVDV